MMMMTKMKPPAMKWPPVAAPSSPDRPSKERAFRPGCNAGHHHRIKQKLLASNAAILMDKLAISENEEQMMTPACLDIGDMIAHSNFFRGQQGLC